MKSATPENVLDLKMSSKRAQPSRVRLNKEEIDKLSKEDLMKSWLLQDQYIDALESKSTDSSEHSELVSLRESEEKLKQQQLEATRRENILVMRLTTKEQEMQEYASQIQELKQAQIPSVAQLRSALLDPAVNLMFEKMRKEMDTIKARLEETQNELSAWKFTPDSNTGKRLMAKCRLLYQENEELGKMISSGKLAKLEGDLALQRTFSEEMKKSQSELDEFLLELDEDVEGMQSTIYYLQQQLREAKEQIQKLQQDKKELSCLLTNSPANQRVVTDDNTDTEGEPVLAVDTVMQQAKENKSFHSQPLAAINDVSRTEGMSNQTSDRGTNSGRPWSPPPVYDHRTESTKTSDQKVPVDEVVEPRQLDEELVDDNNLPAEPPHSEVKIEKEPANDEINNSSSLADAPTASLTHVSLETENDAVLSSTDNGKTVEIVVDSTVQQSTCTERKKTDKKQTARKNAVDSTKRTAENGRGRKRTRPRASVEQNSLENTRELPNPKRTKHNKVSVDCAKLGSNQRTSIEIDTDTEVQVAQTLALWATTKQDRTDNSVNSQEPTSDSLGNGELKENKTETEV